MSFTDVVFAICLTLNATPTVPVQNYTMGNLLLTRISILRTERVDNAQWGEIYVNGRFICYTLENYSKKIPAGEYTVSHTKKGFRLEGVPGRSQINIEVGNYPFESLGCIFVGTKKTSRGVEGSRIALLRLLHSVSLPAVLSVA